MSSLQRHDHVVAVVAACQMETHEHAVSRDPRRTAQRPGKTGDGGCPPAGTKYSASRVDGTEFFGFVRQLSLLETLSLCRAVSNQVVDYVLT